jgi:NAD+ synthase
VIDAAFEVERRVSFLCDVLVQSGQTGFVLGISGGQDSFNAGKLAQLAVDRLNRDTAGDPYHLYAIRLPYGQQRDAADAEKAIEAIRPTDSLVYDIQPAVDAVASLWAAQGMALSDFVKGNLKARIRMVVQYDLAGERHALVIGTDHAAEAVSGFYTKWGDGACDLTPLGSLDKRQGRMLAAHLGAPRAILEKAPTADLLDNVPGQPDETELGMTYDNIDAFLEGRPVDPEVAERIIRRYDKTEHKRAPIPRI